MHTYFTLHKNKVAWGKNLKLKKNSFLKEIDK